jgi:hypothetical protein
MDGKACFESLHAANNVIVDQDADTPSSPASGVGLLDPLEARKARLKAAAAARGTLF